MEYQPDPREDASSEGLAQPFEPLPYGVRVHLVSAQPAMRLTGDYDLRQAWLPFVQALLVPAPASSAVPVAAAKRVPRMRAEEVPPATRWFPPPQKGVPQLPLPFEGWRCLNKSITRRLAEAQWPGWERLPNGKLPTVRIARGRSRDVAAFCEDNCRGRFHIAITAAIFERVCDYVVVNVGFGVGEGG